MEYCFDGAPDAVLDEARIGELLDDLLEQLGSMKRVLLLPPDHTRLHSYAGELTVALYERLCQKTHLRILPTLGTHAPMRAEELTKMFPGIPHDLFEVHDWRNGVVSLGEIPSRLIEQLSRGKLGYSINCEVNRLLVEGNWDRILSIGQLVPHEVIGIAGHAKNVFVGAGGKDMIDKTHFLGAVVGMERFMGRPDTAVRAALDYARTELAADLPISYLLTVRSQDESGELVTRGLFAGDDRACFERGAKLCQEVNLDLLDEPIGKAVVYLPSYEYASTWLGNKAIYRTRMAMADGGELIILAPGVRTFGEDPGIDRLIRAYGYRGTKATLARVEENPELAQNLSAAAHLIHGSSEGRFRITWCPGGLEKNEIEGVGYAWADIDSMGLRYDPSKLREGWNEMSSGERIFFISNPALGLWGPRARFER